MWEEIKNCLPQDNAAQVAGDYHAIKLAPTLPAGSLIVDLGCGTGVSLDMFRRLAPHASWIGVDIESSPEVNSRVRNDGDFRNYDGIHLPLSADSVDLMYSRQVLEHVRYPHLLLADVARVLKPGASFVGSTSHLEPYHSFSFWNFTPLGFKRLVEEAGMRLVELRPGIDGVTLTTRAYQSNSAEMNRWFRDESPMNQEIDRWGKAENKKVQDVAFRKLSFCGHFCFHVAKGNAV